MQAEYGRYVKRVEQEKEQQKVLDLVYFYHLPLRPNGVALTTSCDLDATKNSLEGLDFSDFAFDTIQDVKKLGRHPLMTMATFLIESQDLIPALQLDKAKMQTFLLTVEASYRRLPYHNVLHVVDVLRRLHTIIRTLPLEPVQLLAAYIAAVVHDYGHGGVTNSFLVATDNFLARRYNDQSPWENFHASESMELLRMDHLAFVPRDLYPDVRALVIQLVLSTCMSRHVDTVRAPQKTGDRTTWLLKLALKCADVGHTASPPHVHTRWTEALAREFEMQAVLERQLGLPETWKTMKDTQLKFFDVIIVPMYELLEHEIPATASLCRQAKANRELYQQA